MRGYTRKLHCEVNFPETLDLSEMIHEAFSAEFAQVYARPVEYLDVVFFVI